MEILRFGLGIRFDVMEGEEEQATPEQLWEEVFSVLTTSDIKGMHVYGGHAAYASEDAYYTCVFTNGKLKEMRRVFRKLHEDAGVEMYLAPTHPFLQNNALEKLEGLAFFGRVQGDGSITGGDEALDVQVCKKRGRRKPAGKGIVFLLAPNHYGEYVPSKRAIRRLTIAARRQFKGVRVLPLPVADGGPGTVDAVLTACDGIRRTVQVQGPDGAPIQAHYAVLKGRAAIIEMPEAFVAAGQAGYCSSFGVGEIIRRALDEGLEHIIIGCPPANMDDFGLGCMRALGVKFLDAQGEEIPSGPEELARLHALDMELMHLRLPSTGFMMMTDTLAAMQDGIAGLDTQESLAAAGGKEGLERYCTLLEQHGKGAAAGQPGSIAAGGLGLSLAGLCGANAIGCVRALLHATEMHTRIRNVSLVVSGDMVIDRGSLSEDKIAGALIQLCRQHKVPLALLAGTVGEGANEVLEQCNCSIFTAPIKSRQDINKENALALLDDSAHRMFRFIRMGREIERVSARKSKQ